MMTADRMMVLVILSQRRDLSMDEAYELIDALLDHIKNITPADRIEEIGAAINRQMHMRLVP